MKNGTNKSRTYCGHGLYMSNKYYKYKDLELMYVIIFIDGLIANIIMQICYILHLRSLRVWIKRDSGQYWPSICHYMPGMMQLFLK